MRILVTGGAGFIGSHTVDALLAKGHQVRILDNFAKPVHLKGRPDYIPADVEVIEGDVRDKSAWLSALKGIDVVYHFAAYQDYLPDFGKFFHVNSVGTALLYEVAVEKKINLKKVIVASSQAVYGEGEYFCADETCAMHQSSYWPEMRNEQQLKKGLWEHACAVCGENLRPRFTAESGVRPRNQYALSKYTQELISLNLGKMHNIPTVAMRYSIVQGPRQSFYNAYSGACRIFCLNCYFDKQPVVYEDGKQLRDFVNIADVVAANIVVLESCRADYEVFNVGGGRAYTILEFADIVAKVFGKDIRPRITGQYRFGDTRHIISDVRKLKTLGWQPKNSPEKSVADYVHWLTRHKDIEDILDCAGRKMKELNIVRTVE